MLPGKRFNLEVGGQSALAYLPTYHNMINIIITIKNHYHHHNHHQHHHQHHHHNHPYHQQHHHHHHHHHVITDQLKSHQPMDYKQATQRFHVFLNKLPLIHSQSPIVRVKSNYSKNDI